MRVWTDNSTINASLRCIRGEVNDTSDIVSLVDFATALIFADEILVSAFESKESVARTHYVVSEIERLVGTLPVAQHWLEKHQVQMACERAIPSVVRDIQFGFIDKRALISKERLTASPFDSRQITSQPSWLNDIFESGFDGEHIAQLEFNEGALDHGAEYIPDYFVSVSAEIQAVMRSFTTDGHTLADIVLLDDICRFRYNESLAAAAANDQNDVVYMPHGSRGKLYQTGRTGFISFIDSIMLENVRWDLGVMNADNRQVYSLTGLSLVQISNGNAIDLLKMASALRARASAVRDHLRNIKSDYFCQLDALADVRTILSKITNGLISNKNDSDIDYKLEDAVRLILDFVRGTKPTRYNIFALECLQNTSFNSPA